MAAGSQPPPDSVPSKDSSSDDVGRDAVGELLDFVAQVQFALFHPRQLKLIAIARFAHSLNVGVEPAVFDFQHRHDFARIVVVHFFILAQLRFAVIPRRVSGRPLRWAGKPLRYSSDKSSISCFIHITVTRQPTKGN